MSAAAAAAAAASPLPTYAHQQTWKDIQDFLPAGGMLVYHAAARSGKVAGVVGMTFLDQRIQQVADETARNVLVARADMPLAKLGSATGLLRSLRLPMAWTSKMHTLVNDPAALRVFLKDKTSAGSAASMRFLAT